MDILQPHPHDVLCGQSRGINNHIGNSYWQMLVATNKQLYILLPKQETTLLLLRTIVKTIQSQNPPGRFLWKDSKTNKWFDIGVQRAQKNGYDALREALGSDPEVINASLEASQENNPKQQCRRQEQESLETVSERTMVARQLLSPNFNILDVEPFQLGEFNMQCSYCGAFGFAGENKGTEIKPHFGILCCSKGKINLPPYPPFPSELSNL
jgi:hypothetical protein